MTGGISIRPAECVAGFCKHFSLVIHDQRGERMLAARLGLFGQGNRPAQMQKVVFISQ